MKRSVIVVAVAAAVALAGVGGGISARQDEEEDLTSEVRRVVEEVASWPVWQHVELTSALRRRFDRRMLTPARKWIGRYSDLHGRADAGVARILRRGLYEKDTCVRGGGAYFSFTSRTNDYDRGPDIELQRGEFSSGFYGGCFGFVVELPRARFEDVTVEAVPGYMREPGAKLHEERRRRQRAEAKTGRVYAVRSVREGEADTLAVLEVLEMDEDGATFVWRILRRFEVWSRR